MSPFTRLDGIVWQAGMGNPVTLNNFLYLPDREGPATFAFIDLESGMPALFPLNPLALIRFYLPRSFRHRRALFDDVDVERVREHVESRASRLSDRAGPNRNHLRLPRAGQPGRSRSRSRVERKPL